MSADDVRDQQAATRAVLLYATDLRLQAGIPAPPSGPSFTLYWPENGRPTLRAWTGHEWTIPETSWRAAGVWIRYAATGLGAPLTRAADTDLHTDTNKARRNQ